MVYRFAAGRRVLEDLAGSCRFRFNGRSSVSVCVCVSFYTSIGYIHRICNYGVFRWRIERKYKTPWQMQAMTMNTFLYVHCGVLLCVTFEPIQNKIRTIVFCFYLSMSVFFSM